MSISASVDYDISDAMSVTAGLGTNSIHEGTNLNYGYALTGTTTPRAAFTWDSLLHSKQSFEHPIE